MLLQVLFRADNVWASALETEPPFLWSSSSLPIYFNNTIAGYPCVNYFLIYGIHSNYQCLLITDVDTVFGILQEAQDCTN